MPFTTTYLCEMDFFAMLTITSELRNIVSVDSNLKLKLSNTEPDVSTLIATMPIHPFH